MMILGMFYRLIDDERCPVKLAVNMLVAIVVGIPIMLLVLAALGFPILIEAEKVQ